MFLLGRTGSLVKDDKLDTQNADPSDHEPERSGGGFLPVGQVFGLQPRLDGQSHCASHLSQHLSPGTCSSAQVERGGKISSNSPATPAISGGQYDMRFTAEAKYVIIAPALPSKNAGKQYFQ